MSTYQYRESGLVDNTAYIGILQFTGNTFGNWYQYNGAGTDTMFKNQWSIHLGEQHTVNRTPITVSTTFLGFTANVTDGALMNKTWEYGWVEMFSPYDFSTLPFLSTPGEFTVDAGGVVAITSQITDINASATDHRDNYLAIVIREKGGTLMFSEGLGTTFGDKVVITVLDPDFAGGASDEIKNTAEDITVKTTDTAITLTTPNYTASLPTAAPVDGEVLTYDSASGNLIWSKPMLTATEKTQLGNIHAANMNKTVIDETANTLTVYADDGTTILKVFDLKDASGTPSTDAIAQRIPQ